MSYYRQPEFYRSFRCMGGKCPGTCCAMWTINWKSEEVERLKNADCSPELRALIDSSFMASKDKDTMWVDLKKENGMKCPLQDENGLCRIQKELGEEYLSQVCKQYPRANIVGSNAVFRTCCASCPAVMDILLKDENAMRLVSAPIEVEHQSVLGNKDTYDLLKKHPELKHRGEILDFFFDIIENKNHPLEVSLLLGALAAQKLTEFVNKGQADRIPEVIKALRPQLNRDNIPAFDNAVPDPQINPGFIAELTDAFSSTSLLNDLMEGDVLILSRCAEGRKIADDFLADKPYFMRNLALNMFMTGGLPFMVCDESIFMNYSYFVSTVCSARFILGASAYSQGKVNQEVLLILCYYIRGMYHNSKRVPGIMDIIKEKGCTSPAFLALLLK